MDESSAVRRALGLGPEADSADVLAEIGWLQGAAETAQASDAFADAVREINTARITVAADARWAVGARPGQVVHHVDGDATNNDPANLKIVDPAENVHNRP